MLLLNDLWCQVIPFKDQLDHDWVSGHGGNWYRRSSRNTHGSSGWIWQVDSKDVICLKCGSLHDRVPNRFPRSGGHHVPTVQVGDPITILSQSFHYGPCTQCLTH